MHQSNCLYFHRVSSAVVCIFLMKLLGWFCCKQYTLTHPNTHFVYSYCIYKLCLKLLWTCHKNWASVRFAMQPTTVCQISSSFFWLPEHFINGKSYELCESCDICIFSAVCVCVSLSLWWFNLALLPIYMQAGELSPCSSRLPLFCCYFLPSETFDF